MAELYILVQILSDREAALLHPLDSYHCDNRFRPLQNDLVHVQVKCAQVHRLCSGSMDDVLASMLAYIVLYYRTKRRQSRYRSGKVLVQVF